MAGNDNIRKVSFETPVEGHPNVWIICWNTPCFVRDARGRTVYVNGEPVHATVSDEEFEGLHDETQDGYLSPSIAKNGEKAYEGVITKTEKGLALLDYGMEFSIRFDSSDRISDDEAVKMAREPTAEEYAVMLEVQKIPRRFEALFQKNRFTAEDREASRRYLAMDRLCRSRPLYGSTGDIVEAIRQKRMDVYVIRERSRSGHKRPYSRTFGLQVVTDALKEKGFKRSIPPRWKTGTKRGMLLTAEGVTAERKPDGDPRFILYYEMPTDDKRGLVIAFETAVFKKVRLAKHHMLLNWYPVFLWDNRPPSRKGGQPTQETEPAEFTDDGNPDVEDAPDTGTKGA
jgi:hypothetical protein